MRNSSGRQEAALVLNSEHGFEPIPSSLCISVTSSVNVGHYYLPERAHVSIKGGQMYTAGTQYMFAHSLPLTVFAAAWPARPHLILAAVFLACQS